MQETRDEILTILAHDSRTAPETIAKMTGRSVADVKKAIADYESAGIIKHYTTIIDWDKAGSEKVVAFIDVKVIPARDVGFDRIAQRIYRFEEVYGVWLVSGGSDLRVAVRGADLREVGRFVAEKLATIEGVTGTQTHFMMRRYKEDGIIFAESEADDRLVVSP